MVYSTQCESECVTVEERHEVRSGILYTVRKLMYDCARKTLGRKWYTLK